MKTFCEYLLGKGFIERTVKQYCRKIHDFLNWMEDENLAVEQLRYNDLLCYIRHKTSAASHPGGSSEQK